MLGDGSTGKMLGVQAPELSLAPRTHIKARSRDKHLKFQCWGGRDRNPLATYRFSERPSQRTTWGKDRGGPSSVECHMSVQSTHIHKHIHTPNKKSKWNLQCSTYITTVKTKGTQYKSPKMLSLTKAGPAHLCGRTFPSSTSDLCPPHNHLYISPSRRPLNLLLAEVGTSQSGKQSLSSLMFQSAAFTPKRNSHSWDYQPWRPAWKGNS